MRSPRSRNAAPSSPSDDDRCRAGGGVGGVATGDDAARGGIDSSAGAPPRLRRSRANGVFAARLCGVDVRLGGVGASDGGGAAGGDAAGAGGAASAASDSSLVLGPNLHARLASATCASILYSPGRHRATPRRREIRRCPRDEAVDAVLAREPPSRLRVVAVSVAVAVGAERRPRLRVGRRRRSRRAVVPQARREQRVGVVRRRERGRGRAEVARRPGVRQSSEAGGPDADCDVEHAALCVRRSEGERQPQKGRAADQRAAEREGRVVVDHGSHDGLDDGADRLAVLGLGRPETSILRQAAMTELGNGLHAAKHYEDALSVGEAELAMLWRLGAPEDFILATLSNLATTYSRMGRNEEAVQMQRDVYSGRLKLNDEEHYDTLWAPRARCLTGQFADWSCGMPKYTNDWHCRLPSS